jgi:O-antigen ligase
MLRIQDVLLASLLLTYPLIPGRVLGLPTSAHGLLLGAAVLIYVFTVRRQDVRAAVPYLAFFVPFGVAMVLASAGFEVGYVRSLFLGGIASYLFARSLRPPASTRLLDWFLLIIALTAFMRVAYALFPEVWAWTLAARLSLALLNTTFADPILYGLFLIVGLASSVSLYLRYGSIARLAVVVILILAVIANAVRGVWVGAVIATLVAAGLARSPRRTVVVLAVMLIAFWGFRAAMQARLDSCDPLSEPCRYALDIKLKATLSAKNREDFSQTGRIALIKAGLAAWRESPFLGIGPGRFAERSNEYVPQGTHLTLDDGTGPFDPHNMYLAILTDAGLLGFAGFTGMLGMIVIPAFILARRRTASPALIVLLPAFVGLSIVGLAHDIHLDRAWWIVLGLLHGVSRGQE